jgi:STE24 endopeptidase
LNIYGILIVIILILVVLYELIIEIINKIYIKKSCNNPPKDVFKFYPLETLKKSAEYFECKTNIAIYSKILHYTIFFLLLISGVFQLFALELYNIFKSEYTCAIIFFTCYQLFFALFQLPFDLYQTFVIEKKYNFNKTTPFIFIKDLFLNAIISIIILSILLSIIISFINTGGSHWYLYATVAVLLFYMFLIYLYPVVIAPLFNKFEPLKNTDLKEKIFSLAKKANFPIKNILQMDASKRSSHSNAFFSGLGKNRRIVLFDTILKNHSDEEILAILAHEIGHYKKRHLEKTFILIFIVTINFFYVAAFLINSEFIYNALGFEKHIFIGLFIVSIIFEPIIEIIKPVFMYFSRKHEYEADKFALSLNINENLMVETLIKLHKDNLSYPLPHPLYVKLHYSHPPLISRIKMLEANNK